MLQNRTATLGFVPTMGALHEGHLALVAEAKRRCDRVLVSIFVNPLQFNNSNDLDKYPRTVEADLRLLENAGADYVFIPSADEMYPEGFQTATLDISPLDSVFEGAFRPGHFQGVVAVLYQLFQLIQPDTVVFGLKDLQQCLVVEKLIGKHFPHIEQINMPTLREKSGLAMSSRNTRLSPEGLQKAALIYEMLDDLKENVADFNKHAAAWTNKLKLSGIETEYVQLVALPDMQIPQENAVPDRAAIVFAGYLEGVRLIDNVLI